MSIVCGSRKTCRDNNRDHDGTDCGTGGGVCERLVGMGGGGAARRGRTLVLGSLWELVDHDLRISRRIVVTIAVLGCLMSLIGLTVSENNQIALLKRGVTTTATVTAVGWQNRNELYQIQYVGVGGVIEGRETTALHSGAKVGDRVRVVYDPQNPENTGESGNQIAVMVLGFAFLGPLGTFLCWIAYSATRAAPSRLVRWFIGMPRPRIPTPHPRGHGARVPGKRQPRRSTRRRTSRR